jgi:chaperone required for assembly of F1-ATPase
MSAPRRFYQNASVCEAAGGYGVTLDARALKTPAGAALAVPTCALAEACAEEWNAQGEHIVPARMPLTQLAFAALDWTAKGRPERVAYIASFGATDLCCHRAGAPAALAARQAGAWDPLVAWGASALGAALPVVVGVIAADVDAAALAALRAHADALDDFRLTALTQATGLAGSALIGFALLRGRLGAEAAFAASALDELWSLEHWGEDAEASARLDSQHAEFHNIARFTMALA